MKAVSILTLLMVLLFSCISKKVTYPYFTTLDMDDSELEKLFTDVLEYKGIDLNGFIDKLENIDSTGKLIDSKITGLIETKVIINKEGNVEVVYFTESIDHYTDSLAFEAIIRSSFKPINLNNMNEKYAILIHYYVKNGLPSKSFVNNVSTEILGNPSVKTIKDLTTKREYFLRNNSGYPTFVNSPEFEGEVKLKVILDKLGTVEYAKVLSSTNPLLSEIALMTTNQYRFEPVSIHEKPIDAIITINFLNSLELFSN